MGSGASKRLRHVQPQVNVKAPSRNPEYPTHIASHPEMLQEQSMNEDSEDESDEEISSQDSQESVERNVQPRVIVMASSRNPECPTHIAAHPDMLQEQSLSEDSEDQSDEETSSQESAEWDTSHTGTLRRYQISYPEQAAAFQKMFENMQELRNAINNSSRRSHRDSEQAVVASLQALNNDIRTSSRVVASTKMRVLDFIVKIEAAQLLQRVAQNYFKDFYDISSEDETFETCFCLKKVLGTILNFTDINDFFCSESAEAGVVPMCLENIVRLDRENDNWQSGESDPHRLIVYCLGILHNIARRLRDRELFTGSEKTLLYFAKVTPVSEAAVSALLCLAYLVNEESNHLISADENLLRTIISMLSKAYQSEERRFIGFSVKELAEGLSHLAINDNNNKILGQNGAIPVITAILQSSNDDEERASGARALWMLAFDDTNKDAIRQQDGTLDTLRALHHSANSEVQEVAAGALWETEGKKARNNAENTEETTGNHVMISYQWDTQEVLVEVKKKLEASGYRVWMDLDQMGGSTLEAMAKAVENAAVVLVCMSQRYKESPNCRSEAEYAYELRKDIIPLMMQRNYKADGWLGMLVGTKLRIGFESKQVVDSGVEKLIKELGRRGKDLDTTDGPKDARIRPSEASVVKAPPPQSVTIVSSWTNQDVKKWLTEIGLEQVCKKDNPEFNGQTLIDLQELRGECPEYFYKCLEHTLKSKNMFHLLKFRRELDKL